MTSNMQPQSDPTPRTTLTPRNLPGVNASSVEAAAGSSEGLVPPKARRRGGKRRGSIIVLALGVLAILAIAAVSYVAIVRVDRASVVASQRIIRVQPQVNTVTAAIGDILAADLFGNKVVTSDTPTGVWPGAFEDGDYIDMPRLDMPSSGQSWANGDNLDTNPLNAMVIGNSNISTVGNPEDAWLAATDPVLRTPIDRSYWPQITNLRSTFKYEPRSGSRPERWLRGDGQYLDLMQWFFNTTSAGNANPAADLSANNAHKPIQGTAFYNGVDVSNPVSVFGVQMNRVDNDASDPGTISNDQERMWCDTDGDLRPDARWQKVDALGNAFGLNWVVAARIIDASSLVNFNTATIFPYQQELTSGLPSNRNWTHVVGTGETPADVDLTRLLGYMAPTLGTSRQALLMSELSSAGQIWPVPVDARRLLDNTDTKPTFRELLFNAMGFGTTITNLSTPPVPANQPDYNPPYEPRINRDPSRYPQEAFSGTNIAFNAADIPTASQRAVWWDLLTADSDYPAPRSVQPTTIRDFADLHAFRATNNTTVTGKLEQFIDGPDDANGYLPGSTDNAPYGPLRSREGVEGNNSAASASPRRIGDGTQNSGSTAGLPTPLQMAWDNRHLLTPISGVGRIGPVPVLNTPAYPVQNSPSGGTQSQRSYFDGLSSLERINLPELEKTLDTKGLDRDTAQRVFDAFVWALAPLATDRPLTRDLVGMTATSGDTISRHYGGTTNGPAAKLVADTGLGAATFRSSYALLKALGLTVNLMDAVDSASPTGGQLGEVPTVVRFVPDSQRSLKDIIPSSTVPLIGARLAQGNLPDQPALPDRIFGNISGGVTAVGVDRQPFLVQASYYAVYEDADAAAANGVPTATIEPQSAGPAFKDQMGSIMAFELRNPWPQTIDLANYKVVVRNAAAGNGIQLEFDLGAAENVSALLLARGASAVCYYRMGNINAPTEMRDSWDNSGDPFGTGAPESIVSRFQDLCVLNGAAPAVVRLTPLTVRASVDGAAGNPPTFTAPADLPPVFADFLLGGTGAVAQSRIIPVLLVRKSGPGVAFDTVVDRLAPPGTGGGDFPRVETDDYTVAFPLITVSPGNDVQTQGKLRIMAASTVHRPTGDPAQVGVPAYIAERRENNKAQVLPLLPEGPYVIGGNVTNQRRQEWITGPVGSGITIDPIPTPSETVLTGEGLQGPGSDTTWQTIGTPNKGTFNVLGVPYTGKFSLFNPSRHVNPDPPPPALPGSGTLDPETPPPGPAIRSAADLLLIPTVATFYVHPDSGPPLVGDAADLSLSYNAAGDKIVFATNAARGAWVTASEQLGSDWELIRDPAMPASPYVPNAYAGMLDPTQYVLSSQITSGQDAIPDFLTIPLALRVVDAFDGLKHRGDLAVGKINLNTAPARVLQCVPFLSPLATVLNANDATGGASVTALPAPQDSDPLHYPLLWDWLLPWRSLGVEGNPSSPINRTAATRGNRAGIPEFRKRGNRAPEFGLTSVGELAALAVHDPANGQITATTINDTGFAHVGANGQVEKGVPFGRPGLPASHVFDDGTVTYRVQDGPEEKAALLRALSNVVSTRSDVFIAWFVLRGYDPDVIESINVNGGTAPPDLAQARMAMNNEKFRPTVDTRWLVVYDRSNVKLPTDRPKVLLQMELPSARP